MRIAGIDPGVTGACSIFNDAGALELVIDLPTAGGEVFGYALKRSMLDARIDHAYVEMIHAMPRNGSKAAFSQGNTWGTIRTALQCANIPLTTVSPIAWKSRFHLNQRGLSDSQRKEAARLRAIELFPGWTCFDRKKDHNRAEAAMIGLYGCQELR